MQRRSPDEIAVMSYREYKIDVWKRLADGWREKLGHPLHDQGYVQAKIARCDGMAKEFARKLRR